MKKALFVGLLALLALVWAAGTPAGTEIRNQASASYVDSSGQPQTTTSNEVVTVVQAVYGFEIKPDGTEESPGQTKSGLAGAPVYFHYTVTNTGNATDTINLTYAQGSTGDTDDFDLESPTTYLDANCNGQVDPGEGTVSAVTLAADASACLIVEATIPSSATDGKKGNLNLVGKGEAGTPSDTDDDVDETGDPNWAQAVVTSAAAISATKSASISGEVAPGATLTYTIEGQNTGGSAAGAVDNVDGNSHNGLLVEDAIPEGTTYVLGSASGSAGAGSVSVIYKTASGWTNSEPATASDVKAVGLLIEGSGAFFPQGAQFTFSFQVQVSADAPAGSTIENVASVQFDATGDGDANDPGESVNTNTTTNPVATVAGVQNGPQNDPDADGTGFDPNAGYTDPTGTTWYYTETTGDPNDAETIDSTRSPVYGGDTVYFENTLKNTGNAPDRFTLSLEGVPADWVCQLVAADGTTPISGPVGPLDPNGVFNYVVKCSIPADEVTNDDTEITVTATSENDPAVSNPVKDVVPPVQSGYGVDLAQHGEAGDDDPSDDNPPAVNANPGDTVLFPFDIKNTGHNPDTYDLAAQVPAGFAATIYPDADCDGAMDTPTPAPVTDTGLMDAGETKCFILGVSVPEDQAPIDLDGTPGTSDDNIQITATSHADPSKTDTISTDLEVNEVVSLDFTPDRSGTVTSPGTIVYTHTLTNDGNTSVAVSFSVSGSTHPTWTYQISTDGGSTWSDPADASVSLGAGASQEIQVRVIVPDGEPIGAVDAVTVTATAGSVSASVTDTTTVVGGDLRLEKQVDKTEAVPGDTLTYTITASNIGTADLKQVIVSDPLPGYTDFVSVSASASGISGTVLYSTDGSTWSSSAPTSLNAGEAIYVAVDTNGDDTITDADVMPPGASITITFVVRVQ